ncbi:hypothetical protein GCM10009608_42080 [Pseudonocardia alaniniphila]
MVPFPEKIVCAGLNYRAHILEMGRELPGVPTSFAKYGRSLIGAYDPIMLPAGSEQVDWEAELGVVVGAEVRHATREQAAAAIAGYTVVNDITARDFQYRTLSGCRARPSRRARRSGPGWSPPRTGRFPASSRAAWTAS